MGKLTSYLACRPHCRYLRRGEGPGHAQPLTTCATLGLARGPQRRILCSAGMGMHVRDAGSHDLQQEKKGLPVFFFLIRDIEWPKSKLGLVPVCAPRAPPLLLYRDTCPEQHAISLGGQPRCVAEAAEAAAVATLMAQKGVVPTDPGVGGCGLYFDSIGGRYPYRCAACAFFGRILRITKKPTFC